MRPTKRVPCKRFAFRPEFEALEARTLLDCTAVFAAGIITITGTKQADTVLIQDEGNLNATKKVTVFCDGVLKLQVDGNTVNGIQLNMGKKNDNVTYNLLGSLNGFLPGGSRGITGNLGYGNDTFTANLQSHLNSGDMTFNVLGYQGDDDMTLNVQGDLLGTATLNATLDGGQGKDTLSFSAVSAPDLFTPGVDIGASAAMAINLLGAQNADTISAAYNGDLDGDLNLIADGAKGKDVIDAVFTLRFSSGLPGFTPASLSAQVLGKKGKDDLSLVVDNQSFFGNIDINALLDGGTQTDTCSTAGSNVPVTVQNCP